VRRLVLISGPLGILGPLAVLGLVLLPGSAVGLFRDGSAAPASLPASRPPTADPAALTLLQKASHAPRYVTYRGEQFVSAWTRQGSTGLVVDVSHEPGQGTTVRTRGTPTARADTTYLPADETRTSLLTGATTLTLLGEHYDLSLGAVGSVAGRTADVVVVTAPGAKHPTARFWIDRATSLVLRREVYDEQGRITRASAFLDLAVGAAAVTGGGSGSGASDGAHSYSGKHWSRPNAWNTSLDQATLTRMRAKGWNCPEWLDTRLQLVDARRGDGDYDDIVHLSYSDGLASVSVFEQRGRLEAADLDGYRAQTVRGREVYVRDGVPQRLVWSTGGTVFTVVADASPRTVGDVVAALPHAPPDRGALDRLGRGLDRVASWFNPFG
jgi:sigma-E factor negative regulatory protein RseB